MALEEYSESLYRFEPGPIDVHVHPRVFDALTPDTFLIENGGTEGKAGLASYTAVALESGLTAMVAMPNEQLRLYNPAQPGQTDLLPYPIANLDRLRAMQSAISHEAVIPVGIHFGVDPREIFVGNRPRWSKLRDNFASAGGECTGLKLYGDETTGGNNIDIRYLPKAAAIWHEMYPEKPVIMHLEDQNVAKVLWDIFELPKGKDIPIHIAHVSSREELEAVIAAKQAGMNVTCEVTPHHLFVDASAQSEVGGYACMKPTLKSEEDIAFLWANLRYIDIIASDCAPHRLADKEAAKPAYGVTNHTTMLPLLFGAARDGKITMDELYAKLCINPRQRFNLPLNDGSFADFDVAAPFDAARAYRLHAGLRYGHNLFEKVYREFHLLGELVDIRAGESRHLKPKTSYTHLIRPQNLGVTAVYYAEGFNGEER